MSGELSFEDSVFRGNRIIPRLFSYRGLALSAVLAIVVGTAGWTVVILRSENLGIDESLTFFAILTAVAGVLFGASVQAYIRVRQHSMNLMINSRFLDRYREYLVTVRKYFKNKDDIISRQDAEKIIRYGDKNDDEFTNCLSTLLDYYEFIAICLYYGDIDEEIAKSFLLDIVLLIYVRSYRLVEVWIDIHGPDTFIYLRCLCSEWSKTSTQLPVYEQILREQLAATANAS